MMNIERMDVFVNIGKLDIDGNMILKSYRDMYDSSLGPNQR